MLSSPVKPSLNPYLQQQPLLNKTGGGADLPPTSWVPKLGATNLRTRGVSFPGNNQPLPPSGPGTPISTSPGSESPPSGLSPKPPLSAAPSRANSAHRLQSSLNPERSDYSSPDMDRVLSGLMFDPQDPELPIWVPQVFERLARLEGSSGGGRATSASATLSLPESVALGSRLQVLEDSLRSTQQTIRSLQNTQTEHTGLLYRQDRRGPAADVSSLETRLASCEVLMSSCSARLEDHDAQILEVGHRLQIQGSQVRDRDAALQELLDRLQHTVASTEAQLQELQAKVAAQEGARGKGAADKAAAAAAAGAGPEAAAAAAALERRVSELEERVGFQETGVHATGEATVQAHQALQDLSQRMQASEQASAGSGAALQLLAAKIAELQMEVARRPAPPQQQQPEPGGGSGKALRLSLTEGAAPAGVSSAALKEAEARLDKRLVEVEQFLRKHGKDITSLETIAESDDSYTSSRMGGGMGLGLDPEQMAADRAATHKAITESSRALAEAAAATQELSMMKAALRMLHDKVGRGGSAGGPRGSLDGGGGGGGGGGDAHRALQKADALEVIAKNFAGRLDGLAQEVRAAQMAGEHAMQAAMGNLMLQAPVALGGAAAAAPLPGGVNSPKRGVKFAGDDGGGGAGASPLGQQLQQQQVAMEVRRLAQQQMEMLGRFQMMERDLMLSMGAYTKSAELKELENAVMERLAGLQQEVELMKVNQRDMQCMAFQQNLSSQMYGGGGGGGGYPQQMMGSASAGANAGNSLMATSGRTLAHNQSLAVARRVTHGGHEPGSPVKVKI